MPRSEYYGARRVPQAFPPTHLRLRLLPLMPGIAASAVLSGLAQEARMLPEDLRDLARDRSEALGSRILEDAQRIFFDEPGLDTLLMRAASGLARRVTDAGRAYLRTRMLMGLDRSGRAARMLPLLPRPGYDSAMMSIMAVGTALGRFRGGAVHVRAFDDSGIAPPDGPRLPVPSGHPTPAVRRFEAPESLGDMAADIDDLYWAMSYGQSLKVTRVGDPARGGRRRWLISIPGTDHWNLKSTPNPADLEANVREVLNVPSAVRIGVVRALHAAMRADGVPPEQWEREPVLAAGHSQGGMVATALASADPHDVGVDVTGVLAMGAPSRRLRIRDDVVMVAVAHDQDVVPSFDGTPARAADRRVTITRRLVRPRQGPLYYAHASTTYTETVRQIERRASVAHWGRADRAISRLREYLPRPGEPTRVWMFDVWQDILEPNRGSTWDSYVALDRPSWEPAAFAAEWAPYRLADVPEVRAVRDAVSGAVTEIVGDVVTAIQRVAPPSAVGDTGGSGADSADSARAADSGPAPGPDLSGHEGDSPTRPNNEET